MVTTGCFILVVSNFKVKNPKGFRDYSTGKQYDKKALKKCVV